MSRELNKELFGDLDHGQNQKPWEAAIQAPGVKLEDFRGLVHQVEVLARRLKEHETQQENARTRTHEMIGALKSRVERVGSALQAKDETAKNSAHELLAKMAMLNAKVTERSLHETKVEEMVDRYSQTVRQFEVKLSQLTKLINDQELKLAASKSALHEALRELARIKK